MLAALACWPAGAEVPQAPDLPLPTPIPSLGPAPDSGAGDPLGLLEGVPDQLLNGPAASTPGPSGAGAESDPREPATRSGSWSTARTIPGNAPAPDGGRERPVPSYGAALGRGIAQVAQRAARLAGPLAPTFLLALLAVAVLVTAARGPGRLVKIEEEREALRGRRAFRL